MTEPRTMTTEAMSRSFWSRACGGSRCAGRSAMGRAPSEREGRPRDRGDRGDGDARDEIGVHTMVELDDVLARRHVHRELADRVGADRRGAAVDGRVPSGVVCLSQDDLLAVPDVDLRSPAAETALLELVGAATPPMLATTMRASPTGATS